MCNMSVITIDEGKLNQLANIFQHSDYGAVGSVPVCIAITKKCQLIKDRQNTGHILNQAGATVFTN